MTLNISETIHITRKHVTRACEYCRKKHKKCDEQAVCRNCFLNNGNNCVRRLPARRGPKRRKHNREINNIDDTSNNNNDNNSNNTVPSSQGSISLTLTTPFHLSNYHPMDTLNTNNLIQYYSQITTTTLPPADNNNIDDNGTANPIFTLSTNIPYQSSCFSHVHFCTFENENIVDSFINGIRTPFHLSNNGDDYSSDTTYFIPI